MISLLAAVTDVSALITFASSRLPAVPSVARAATPMPATPLAQISDTATILRWVIRSALTMDVLFMTLPQSLDFASSLLHRVRLRFTALFFGVTSRACSAFPAGAGGGGWGGFRVRRSMLPRPAEARLRAMAARERHVGRIVGRAGAALQLGDCRATGRGYLTHKGRTDALHVCSGLTPHIGYPLDMIIRAVKKLISTNVFGCPRLYFFRLPR